MIEIDDKNLDNISNNTLAKIRGMLASVSPSERKIGEFILANHRDIPQMTLAEVASESGVSDATAVRYFRTMGYKRWLDLKIALSVSQGSTPDLIHEQVAVGDSVKEVTEKVIVGAISALKETAAVLDPQAMETAINLIHGARRILIIGAGTSGPVAKEMFNRFFRLGLNCQVETDAYLQVMQSALLSPDDLLIAISQTGESSHTVRTAVVAKERSSPVICITGNKLSELAKNSDVVLLSVSHEVMVETTASRIAQYALVHALYINLAVCCSEETLANERRIWDALTRMQNHN
jgi:DNA-binding MurR/RpiR family transcriptional regulator